MMGGSPGGTVSLANSFPEVALRLYQLGTERDAVHGPAYQEFVGRINKAISGTHGVAGVKAAMDLAGFVGGRPRRPLLPLDDRPREELRALLEAEGLL
jgi:4-hydroxy-2-oxoglutarate aldolase